MDQIVSIYIYIYIEVFTPSPDLTWKLGVYRCRQAKMGSLVGPNFSRTGVLMRRGKCHMRTETCRGNTCDTQGTHAVLQWQVKEGLGPASTFISDF